MSKEYNIEEQTGYFLCEPIAEYSRVSARRAKQLYLFEDDAPKVDKGDIKIIELFAGVGGFRVGFERASNRFKTIWNNQWEPSTKRQDASLVYQHRFGSIGHSNEYYSSLIQQSSCSVHSSLFSSTNSRTSSNDENSNPQFSRSQFNI